MHDRILLTLKEPVTGGGAANLLTSPSVQLRVIENPSFLQDCALLNTKERGILGCKTTICVKCTVADSSNSSRDAN